jgi:hypothetical protein
MTPRSVRLPDETINAIGEYCKRERMNATTFIRQALAEKLTRDNAFEERLASTLGSMRQEQQALIAMLDRFVLAFLTCVPEPSNLTEARANAMLRHEKYLHAVATAYQDKRKNGNGKGAHT